MGDVVVEGGGEIMSMGISLACRQKPDKSYNPQVETVKILDRAWEHVSSVPYQVSARWLFYRLLQDGIYRTKKDYNTFLSIMSRARKNEYGPWRRDTLVDDTRTIYPHERGDRDGSAWAEDFKKHGVRCKLDHWFWQQRYVEIWFEAAAMVSQFRHHTSGIDITLRPFQGMPSIYYKNEAARQISEYARKVYDLPVTILYFGDDDRAGHLIAETSIGDIYTWGDVELHVDRIGLNPGDGKRYGIPEDFEHPGNYQWEALNDETAGSLIKDALKHYVDLQVINEIREEEAAVETALMKHLKTFEFVYKP
ncbi:MAG: hypothetical protein GXY07_21195 [Candidatus Hydrogenedentes bacterium]|nr:hypothetical protein [Candidatus Hydrogenedentota bacterium]